jgi:hydrogenase maturation protease
MNDAPQTLIICVGNSLRGDDGIGHVVAQRLREMQLPDVTVREENGEGTALIDTWTDAAAVILIDAVQSGAAPGTIHRLDASLGPLPFRFFHYSTHAFSVAEAVELARALDQLPPCLIVYGIEGRDFSGGATLSPEVAAAVEEVASRVAHGITMGGEVPSFTGTGA